MIRDQIRSTSNRLAASGIPDARLEADLIWMTALGVDRPTLYGMHYDEPSIKHSSKASALLEQRLERQPMAYLMGTKEFYGLDFEVAPGVLIPRSDTETLVEESIAICRSQLRVKPIVAVDVGCGTGVVSISIASSIPHICFTAVDVATRALEMTRSNAQKNNVYGQINTLKANLTTGIHGGIDLLVANLPYVRSQEIPLLEPEISLYEPREALDGGADGLDLFRAVVSDVPRKMNAPSALLFELDPREMAIASRIAQTAFPRANVRTVRDLAGRHRVLVIECPT